MPQKRQLSFLDEWDAQERRTWQMDSDKSSATLTITPVELGDGRVVYRWRDAIEIHPYPNPLHFGGSWGGGGGGTEEDARAKEQCFLETLSSWDIIDHSDLKAHGMTRITVVWEDKVTRTQHGNDLRAAAGEDQQLLMA